MSADLHSILKIEVPLSVQIASRSMRIREVASLAPGAIIELPKLADEELDVIIGKRQIGTGTAVKVGENFGVRVTRVGTMKQRITAMSPETAETQSEPHAEESGAFTSETTDGADDAATIDKNQSVPNRIEGESA